MERTAGSIVYETIKNYGITCIFGMADPIHVMHAADPKSTRLVTVHDERHGAIMAHAYAQVSGRPGVCSATFGPGASNLITGLLEAYRSSVPVIALVQDHGLRAKGRNANSELDHATVLSPVVKAVLRIDFPDQAGDVVRKAFRVACAGRPGPVVILCPTDVMGVTAEASTHAEQQFAVFPALRPVASEDMIATAARLIAAASRPVLIAGGGAMNSGASTELLALAERFGAPVATTLTGRGLVPDDHALAVGPIGNQTGGKLGRGRVANQIVGEADVVVILGSKTGQLAFGDWKLLDPEAKVVHADIDETEIGRNFPVAAMLVGDIRETLRALIAYCEANELRDTTRDNGGRIAALKEEWQRDNEPYTSSDVTPIRPERVIAEVDSVVDGSTIVVADASYASGWVLSHIGIRDPGRVILSPRGTGSIGWGYAAALGAKVGAPDKNVICVTGDGGFYYLLNELETAARYGISVLCIVLNNSTLGYQRHYEEQALGSYRECDFLDVDFAAVASAMHCGAERVEKPAELAPALRRGLSSGTPYLIDVVISPDVAAPIVGFERGLDLSLGH